MDDCCMVPAPGQTQGCGTARSAFDVAVLGAGTMGFSAAIHAVEAGKTVALVCDGTCVSVAECARRLIRFTCWTAPRSWRSKPCPRV